MASTFVWLLWRDLWQMRVQVLAAALVVGYDIVTSVAMRSTCLTLLNAQQDYYASCRFANLSVHLKRVSLEIVLRVAALPGVSRVDARVVPDVTVDIPGPSESVTARPVSIPEFSWPALNLLYLQSSRHTAPGRRDEVLVSAALVEANSLRAGEYPSTILNGRWKCLYIIGLAISSEYVYEVGAGSILPDSRHYGVVRMGGNAVSAVFCMDGALNDLVLSLDGSVPVLHVIAQIDRTSLPYGGLGTISRDHQLPNRFITDEIAQNHVTVTYVPAIFFLVAIFLLQNVLTRLTDTQRLRVGLIRAFGYGDLSVGLYYLQLGYVVATAGTVVDIGGGLVSGIYLTDLYARYYRLAHLEFRADFSTMAWVFFISSGTVVGGVIASTVEATRLISVEALRAAVPPAFSVGRVEWASIYRQTSVVWRMIVRSIAHQPVKSLLGSLVIACASAIFVVGGFFFDSIDSLFDTQFQQIERQDVMVTFSQPLSHHAIYAIKCLSDVLKVEGFRDIPAKLSAGYWSRRVSLSGIAQKAGPHRLIDDEDGPLHMPPNGLVVSAQLATVFSIRSGDPITIEVFEGEHQIRQVTLMRLPGDPVGAAAYTDQHALAKPLGEGGNWSGIRLPADQHAAVHLYATFKRLLAVSAVAVHQPAIASFHKIMDEGVRLFTSINLAFVCVIAFGVAFNGMRIAYSERVQRLASLRVFGFTQAEVAWILLGKQFVLTAIALPAGLLLGYGVCGLPSIWLATDLHRLPLVVHAATFAYTFVVAGDVIVYSRLLVVAKIRRLDIAAVPKARGS